MVAALVLLDCLTIVASFVIFFDENNTFETIECKSATIAVMDFLSLVIFGVCAVMSCMIKSAMARAKEKTQVIKSRFSIDIEKVQDRTVQKSTFFLYMMIAANLYSFLNTLAIYLFYTEECVPYHISIELDSFF